MQTLSITGTIIFRDSKQGIPGLRVEAWDKDLILDDLVGSAVTDANGRFTISFTRSYFAELFLDRQPDLFFRIFYNDKLIHSTEKNILWNAKTPAEGIIIPLSLDIPGIRDFFVNNDANATQTVSGILRDSDNRPIPAMRIVVYDKDLRREEQLAEGSTDSRGQYNITYPTDRSGNAEAGTVDLLVKAYQGDAVIARSEVLFNAPDKAVLDLRAGEQYKALSGYEQVSAILLPLLDGIAPHELEESEAFPDISFLTGETGLPRVSIENWALAQQLSVKSNIQPEFWYALLAGKLISAPDWKNTANSPTGNNNLLAQQLALVLSGLPAISNSSVTATLREAFNANIISRQWENNIAEWTEAFRRFALQQTGPGGNPQQLQQLLDITNLNKNQKDSFLRLYSDYGDFIKTMQDDLLNKHAFTSENVGSVAATLKLSEITLGNKELAAAVIKEYDINSEAGVKALAGISTTHWKELMAKHAVPVNEAIQGGSEEERLHQYAVLINKRFEQAYPTAAFAGGLQRSMTAKTAALAHATELSDFLAANPDIELAHLHIDYHLQAATQEKQTAAPDAGFVTELKAVQRVFKLAPVYKAVNTLMEANIHSAHQVAQYGEKQFVNTFKDKPGFTKKAATDAWRSAIQTQAAVATIMGEAAAMQDAYHVHALSANKAAMADYANWSQLFGKADICDCEHCRSVYSPAAYMTDTLQFLKNRDTQVVPGEKAKTVLMRRRPDIAFLDLNCANANTTLPYVDIANEIMEEELAPALLFSTALPANWNDNNTIRATLGGIFSGKNITLAADFSVSPVTTITNRQTYACRVVRDSAATYQLKVNGGNIEASLLRQTHGTAAERTAAPEYVNPAAYDILKAAKYPLSLPFDLFNEEARAYLSKVNVQRWQLMETFRSTAPNNTAEDEAAEYFGISIGITPPATTDERTIITQPAIATQHEYWGDYGNNPAMLNEVKMVDTFLQKTGLEYNQLLELLDLPFINPGGLLKIVHEDNSCNTGAKHIAALDAAALDRLHRFIRLWRKLGWEVWEVDLAINSNGIGKGSINGPMLVQLMYADRLLKKYSDITVEQLCVLFGDINTRSKFTALYQDRKLSLYEERFLNKKLINPIDTAFAIAALPGAGLVANHIAVVMGATKSKEQDVNILLNMKKTDGTAFTGNTLTLPNLSFLYRHSLLSRLLGIKIAEWEKLLSITREDIVTLPDAVAAWQLATFADSLHETGFSTDELRYWLQHDLTAKAAPKTTAITGFITALRAQLNAINTAYTVTDIPEENMAAITTQLLRAGWDADTTGTAQSIFTNTYISSVRLAVALPAAFTDFPESVTKNGVTGETIINIQYDAQSRQMTLTGIMTDAHRNLLKTHAALVAVTALPAYTNAIDALYADSRNFITRELRFYKQPLFSEALPLAAATADFSKLPTWLSRHISYDKEKQLLQYKGVMTATEQGIFKALPGNTAAYNAVIDTLFARSTAAVFTPAEQWIGNAELTSYFNTPANYDSATIAANIKAAAIKLFAYLRPADIEAVVIQQVAQQFTLNSDAARFLLTGYAINPPSTDNILQYFINATPPYTNDERIYYWLHKVSGIIQKTGMDLEALQWLKDYAAKTNTIDWLALPAAVGPPVVLLGKLLRLYQYLAFNRRYVVEGTSLWPIIRQLDTAPVYANNTAFAKAVNPWTGWTEKDIVSLTNIGFLNIAYPNAYLQIEGWTRLALAFDMLANINQSAATAAALAVAAVTPAVSQQLKQCIRSRFEDEQWFELSQGIQNTLRERKRDSLATALLVRKPAYVPAGVKWENANDLFSFYLVDVEMCSCQLTSRLVQANGSIQLFVQRCMMALETDIRVDTDEDDGWLQWKWMKNYRVWEANRKVFLYPENWIEPELRRDKSNFFKEFENELLQNEITKETVEDAILSYLNKLDSVAQLEIAGFYYEENKDVLHVFGRTPAGDPHIYYYRQWVKNLRWTPWAKVDVEISSDYLVPYIINNRMYIFWPVFTEMANQPESLEIPAPGGKADKDKKTYPPEKFQKVQMAMSELRHGKWTGKKISKEYLITDKYRGDVVKDRYNFFPADLTGLQGGFYIMCSGYSSRPNGTGYEAGLYGSFEIFGCKGVPEKSDYYKPVNEVIEVVDAESRYLKPTEMPSRGNREDFSFDNFFSYVTGGENNNRRETILNKTPGIFRIITSPNVMEMDTWFASINELKRLMRGTKGNDDTQIPSGIWSSFFYADKTRSFFVQPMLAGGDGVPYYYNDIKAFVQRIRDVWNQLTEDWLKGIPFTPEEKEYARYIFKIIFNSFAAVIIGSLYPARKYHFRNFYHPFVCSFMKETANRGVDGLMRRELQLKNSGFDFKKVYDPTVKVLDTIPPDTTKYYPEEIVDFSGSGSYSQYNWELFFHAPLMIAGMLSKNQRFEEAMQWFHYIFNPLSPLTKDVNGNPIPITSPQQKYWITKPFFERQQIGYDREHIDNILLILAGDTTVPGYNTVYKDKLVEQVADWRNNPFEPHKIAQFRTVAYQKTVVMKYIDNLVAWGDQLFRQDTMESVNQATLLYVLAAEILGPRPQKIPSRIKPITETYNELEKDLDAFSNALVKVENLLPLMAPQEGVEPGVPPIHVLYFCIPQNDKLLGYWDTVADRLYKIRHCLNIEGVFRQLSLFAPPIDPAALVRAVAGGADLASALSDLNAPVPHYRFNITLQKANELCNDVKALGTALSGALEKKDGEAMSLLRQTHELRALNAATDIKKKQLEDANESLAGLYKNKEMTTLKRDFYNTRPFISTGEKRAMDLQADARILQTIAGVLETLGSVLAIIPDFNLGASGFGGTPQVTAMTGGQAFSKAVEFSARGLNQVAGIMDKEAGVASTMAGYVRRKEDWDFQRDLANKELEQMEKQIAGAKIKISIAEKEIKNHELQVENAMAMDEFMRTKYTNKELYEWMTAQLSQTYFRTYQLAYDVAKRAERCYQFELGVTNSSFIQFGYWDSLKKGLLSGEQMQQDLRRLDNAYMEQNRREMELTKHVSLSLTDPLALIQLKEKGRCVVNLPEEVFDLDYPGHYFRRLRSVSLSIPCIAGPHTTINCTLRLLKNSLRVNNKLNGGKYERNNDGGLPLDDDRFRESNVLVKSIATSNAQNDNGLFEMNFRDERYLPFEGAGAVSTWSIELLYHPDEETAMLRQFNYDHISDVILHLRYTAREDAGLFRKAAIKYLKGLVQKAADNNTMPLMNMMSIKHEFPQQYHALGATPVTDVNAFTKLDIRKDRFPYLAQGMKLKVRKVILLAQFKDGGTATVSLTDPGGTALSPMNLVELPRFGKDNKVGIADADFEIKANGTPAAQWEWTLSMPRNRAVQLEDLVMIVLYDLNGA